MNGSYDFLIHLNRLMAAYHRFERFVWVLNAVIISIAFYILAELLGLPAFTRFYWQDSLPLAASPAILCATLGVAGALFLRRRKKPDLFPLLGPELEEKARTAYDNRRIDSLPMHSLATELKGVLSRIKPQKILNPRRIYMRLVVVVLLSGTAILIAHSQIGADITRADFPAFPDPIERALGAVQGETPTPANEENLSPNLYGKPSLAVLSENRMELLLYPGSGAGSMARNTEPVERAFQQSTAGVAAAVPSELYIESLPSQNKEIIKRYFEILNSGSFSP